MRIEVPDGDEVRGELVAIDLETRSIRWTAPDIATECKPTVIDGMGVVAQAQTGSPRLGEDAAELVGLSIREIGRAHVCTPVNNANIVSSLQIEKKTNKL